MKLFLDIGKSPQEIILTVILACPIVGMLLLFGLGLSDATSAEKPPETCQHQTNPRCPDALKKGALGECPKPINPCPLAAAE